MSRIIVVEDDPATQELLIVSLTRAGHEVTGAGDAEGAEEALLRVAPDLMVLDVSLPGATGFALCERIRRTSRVPIMFVTGRASIADKTRAFGVGGDDYLVKPFSPRELVLRVDALLRRVGPPTESTPLRIGDLEIDAATRTVRRDGTSLSLTPTEVDLLAALATTPGRAWPAERLASTLRLAGNTPTETRAAMRVRISRLRRKLEPDPERPRYLHSQRPSGYVLEWRPDGEVPVE